MIKITAPVAQFANGVTVTRHGHEGVYTIHREIQFRLPPAGGEARKSIPISVDGNIFLSKRYSEDVLTVPAYAEVSVELDDDQDIADILFKKPAEKSNPEESPAPVSASSWYLLEVSYFPTTNPIHAMQLVCREVYGDYAELEKCARERHAILRSNPTEYRFFALSPEGRTRLVDTCSNLQVESAYRPGQSKTGKHRWLWIEDSGWRCENCKKEARHSPLTDVDHTEECVPKPAVLAHDWTQLKDDLDTWTCRRCHIEVRDVDDPTGVMQGSCVPSKKEKHRWRKDDSRWVCGLCGISAPFTILHGPPDTPCIPIV